jgi:hypothetical protein
MNVDYEYVSYLFPDSSSEEIAIQMPHQRRIFIHSMGKIFCFDLLELYAWIKSNPGAKIYTPSGELTLDSKNKRQIISTAEEIISTEDRIDACTGGHWHTVDNTLSSIGKYFDDSTPIATQRDTIEQDVQHILLSDSLDPNDARLERIARYTLERGDEEMAVRLPLLFVYFQMSPDQDFVFHFLSDCLRRHSDAILSVVGRESSWLATLSAGKIRELFQLCARERQESTYRLLLSLLEEQGLFPQDPFAVDSLYAILANESAPKSWAEQLFVQAKTAPTVRVVTHFADDCVNGCADWIIGHVDVDSKSDIRDTLRILLVRGKHKQVERFTHAFRDMLEDTERIDTT